jgi:hypothetical protein
MEQKQNKIKSLAECKDEVAKQEEYKDWNHLLDTTTKRDLLKFCDRANALYYSPENTQPTESDKAGDYAIEQAKSYLLSFKDQWKEGEENLYAILCANNQRPAQPVHGEGDLPSFLYRNEHGYVTIGVDGDTMVQDEWNKWLKQHQPTPSNAVQWPSKEQLHDMYITYFPAVDSGTFMEAMSELRTRIGQSSDMSQGMQVDPVELCKIHGHVMYLVCEIDNGRSKYGDHKCSRCKHVESFQYDY